MSDARAVFEAIAACGQDDVLVLATVVATRGSVPRRAGSRMVIDVAHDRIVGTIGGGCGEADVLRVAPEVAREGAPRLLTIELTDAIDSWSPAVCGGVLEVLLEPVVVRPDPSSDAR
ncbi:MAG TPA: XdhC family protein [Longimicrobiales bacterium]